MVAGVTKELHVTKQQQQQAHLGREGNISRGWEDEISKAGEAAEERW